jgi:hypothetical protein
MPVILGIQEAAIRRIVVQSQPGQIVSETLSRKKPSQKKASGMAQGVGPELNSSTTKKMLLSETEKVQIIMLSDGSLAFHWHQFFKR